MAFLMRDFFDTLTSESHKKKASTTTEKCLNHRLVTAVTNVTIFLIFTWEGNHILVASSCLRRCRDFEIVELRGNE
jgi:hypothetical protein